MAKKWPCSCPWELCLRWAQSNGRRLCARHHTECLQLRALQRRRALRRINDAEILASIKKSIGGLRRIKISRLIRSPRSAPPLSSCIIPYITPYRDRGKVLNYSIRTNTILFTTYVIATWRSPSRLVSHNIIIFYLWILMLGGVVTYVC